MNDSSTDVYIPKDNFPNKKIVNELKINGNEHIKVNATSVIISPLQSEANIYMHSIAYGQDEDVIINKIHPGDYTVIEGLKPLVEWYVDTDETFYIKF